MMPSRQHGGRPEAEVSRLCARGSDNTLVELELLFSSKRSTFSFAKEVAAVQTSATTATARDDHRHQSLNRSVLGRNAPRKLEVDALRAALEVAEMKYNCSIHRFAWGGCG